MTEAKQILVLTADAGFGHRSAANAIAAALTEEYGEACIVNIVNPLEDRRVPALLRNSQSDYDKLVREMPKLYRFGYQASDATVPTALVESALTVILFEVMRDIVKRYQPDTIVTTYPLYQAPLEAVYTIRRFHIPLLTVVTDLMTVHRLWFHPAVDLCLVPTKPARQQALEAGLEAQQIRITGIPVHPRLSQESRPPAEIREELGWDPALKTALVVGSKRVGNLEEMLRALNHSGLKLQLAIVAGGNDVLYERLQGVTWHAVTHLYNFVDNMPTLMHAADCVLCKAGGLIATESLACGLPLLLIDVLPGQEIGNAQYVIEGGAGERAGNAVDVLEVLFHWLMNEGARLAERAQCARDLGRPRAAYEIAALAWTAAERDSQAITRRSRLSGLTALLSRFGVRWQD